MSCPDLGSFWEQNKQQIGAALPQGIDVLADVFRRGADAFELRQTVDGRYIDWHTPDGQHAVTFAVLPDPRDLDAALDVYIRAERTGPALMAIFVHQWTDRTGGLAGFDLWIRTLEAGRAGRFGLGYNAAVWAESRKFAVEFLKEAQQRLGGDLSHLFKKAVTHYAAVARDLKAVSDAYPFRECEHVPAEADDRTRTAAEILRQARDAEAAGLDALAELVDKLNG